MIWNQPWKLTEGFLIGGGLIAAGLLLELSIGPVNWQLLAWPVNIVALGVLLLGIAAVSLAGRRVYAFRFLATCAAAVPALAYAVALTVVMGLTRQQQGGTWLNGMLSFWPFVLVYTYVVVILGVVVTRRLVTLRRGHRIKDTVRLMPFLLNHLGLFIALTTATLGNADMQRLQMWTTNNPDMANAYSESDAFHQYECFALTGDGVKQELPLAVELKRFIMEMHDDSITPRRYASEVVIYSKASGHAYTATIDVNRPVEVDGWKIYQKDYRLTSAGDACQISVLELVSDPWLPWVYAGIFMMLAGALLLMFSRKRETRPSKPATII